MARLRLKWSRPLQEGSHFSPENREKHGGRGLRQGRNRAGFVFAEMFPLSLQFLWDNFANSKTDRVP